MRSEFPPPCTVITPEYTPGAGADPARVTVTTVAAPAARMKLGGVTVTDAPLLIPAGVTPNARLTLAAPEFLMVSCRVIGRAAPALTEPEMKPNEIVAGSEVTLAATAASAASMPAPSQRTSATSPESS